MRLFLLLLGALLMSSPANAQVRPKWTLVIHGGAGIIERDRVTPEQETGVRAGLQAALDAGTKVLEAGGSAVDAVEAAVKILEDDPHFNAGRGAVFTWDGKNELDSAIMDGRTRAAGAVAGSTTTRHPVSLARAVMEAGPHVMLSGAGADQFAREHGLEQVDNSFFGTPERRRQLEVLKSQQSNWFDVDLKYGTVGAVAMDMHGNVAAATSTGGLTGKRWGRIGDSPIIGAGTYADNRACAISATGAGEFFIREGVAHEICARIRFKGETAKQAADTVMAETKALGGSGGVIVVSPTGEMAWSFNTPGMYRAKASAGGERVIAFYGED
ncbi:isoaspartyl peptidase/L-asparaginase [Sphingomonas sp. LB-2]|uniref:isoaspartyl peptidase/L-asparaginase family protein n=1 Tax=Sphingomonas caeni TaxID=2984949 RepID=UPI00223160ED|nr:isoaspartyl peptidase/L-asparaginase [Sphingomonas caeni]MCW3846222.1 isoaspartyl peptidase/L-asparaginase [Sphingomonas caeni]